MIYLHGFKEGTKRENFLKKRMEDLVPYMGGFISLKITNEVTHIIVKDLDAAKEILQSPNGDVIYIIYIYIYIRFPWVNR